jgi:hypothetical protein
MPNSYDNDINNPLKFDLLDNIKIYTGTTNNSDNQRLYRIDNYKKISNKKISNKKIFTELTPSTITAKGEFNNICFNEESIINMLSTPNGGYIISIGCNYGVITNPCPNYAPIIKKPRLSKRGRKPKIKIISKRKLQGTGNYFSSQITFEIYNPDTNKIYKIKLFRNGGFQVPGVKRPDMKDLIMPLTILRDYLRTEFLDDNIEISYIISVMRNYICRISDHSNKIRLNSLETLLNQIKDNKFLKKKYNIIDNWLSIIPNVNIINNIKKYIGIIDPIGIAEIQHNSERYFGLIIKFYRPVPWEPNKRTTIKILRSGKINIDGGNSINEVYELYYWLENLFSDNIETIIYKPEPDNTYYSDEYDIGSGRSIYDDDEDYLQCLKMLES